MCHFFWTYLWFICTFWVLFVNLDPRKKYHVKLLAYNVVGDGYQADQTISTPGCVCKSHHTCNKKRLYFSLSEAQSPNTAGWNNITLDVSLSCQRPTRATATSAAQRARQDEQFHLCVPELGSAGLHLQPLSQLHRPLQPSRPAERFAGALPADVRVPSYAVFPLQELHSLHLHCWFTAQHTK